MHSQPSARDLSSSPSNQCQILGYCKAVAAGKLVTCTSLDTCQYAIQTRDPYLVVLDEMRELHVKKAADYGGNTGTDNLRASTEFGIEPWLGTVLRMNDKVTRIKSLVKNGKLENESIDDSLIDIAAYAILALCLLRESRNNEN